MLSQNRVKGKALTRHNSSYWESESYRREYKEYSTYPMASTDGKGKDTCSFSMFNIGLGL